MAVALSPFGGVSSRWACELNVLHLQTVGGLLVSMEHPHAAGCQYVIASPDLLLAKVVRVGGEICGTVRDESMQSFRESPQPPEPVIDIHRCC